MKRSLYFVRLLVAPTVPFWPQVARSGRRSSTAGSLAVRSLNAVNPGHVVVCEAYRIGRTM